MTQVTKGVAYIDDCVLFLEDSLGKRLYDIASFIPDPRDFLIGKVKVDIGYELLYEGKLLPVLWYVQVGDVKLIKF